jgi:hypothetical protein
MAVTVTKGRRRLREASLPNARGRCSFLWRATLGQVAAGALLAAALVPVGWLEAAPLLCPFRLLTGLPCPGCGLTRSVVALAHADLTAAVHLHPLGPALVGLLGAVVLCEAFRRWAPREWELWARVLSTRLGAPARLARGDAWLWIAGGALVAVWLLRLPLYLTGRWVY